MERGLLGRQALEQSGVCVLGRGGGGGWGLILARKTVKKQQPALLTGAVFSWTGLGRARGLQALESSIKSPA